MFQIKSEYLYNMKNRFNINKVITEWAYRLTNGTPSMGNGYDLLVLRQILTEQGYPPEFVHEYMNKLSEDDIVKNKKSGNQYVVQNHNPDTQTLVTKDASAEEIEKAEMGKEDPKSETPQGKNKTLKADIKYEGEDIPESITRDISPTDNEFESGEFRKRNKVIKQEYKVNEVTTNSGKTYTLPISTETLEEFFPSPPNKFNKRYLTAIQRILDTKQVSKTEPTITSFLDGVGAGEIPAQSAELLTLMSTSIGDEQFNELMDLLEQSADASNGRRILDKEWLHSVRGSRNTIRNQAKQFYGEDAEIEFSGWDTKEDVENGIGLPDYADNKGHSTDVYFRVKSGTGESSILEVSLKKDLVVYFASPGSGKFMNSMQKDGVEIPEQYDANIFANKQKQNAINYLGNTTQNSIDDISAMAQSDEAALVNDLSQLPPPVNNLLEGPAGNKTLTKKFVNLINYTNKLKELGLEYPLDSETYNSSEHKALLKEHGFSGGKGAQVLAITMGYAQMAVEGYPDNLGAGYDYVNNQVGIDINEDGDYPEGSTRNFERKAVEFLMTPDAKPYTMKLIRDKFPLSTLFSGEETMALGNFGLDPKTCEKIFGTTNYDEVEEHLSVEFDQEEAQHYLSYEVEVEGKPKRIRIAEVECRQRGKGYQGPPTYGLQLGDEIRHRIICANGEKDYTSSEQKMINKMTKKFGQCDNPSYGE